MHDEGPKMSSTTNTSLHSRALHFWTCDELLPALPQVSKLREIFNLFKRPNSVNSIDVAKIADCLRATGLLFDELELKSCLSKLFMKFPRAKSPPASANFESVLSIYSELSSRKDDTLSAEMLIKELRCFDIHGTGKLSYGELRHMLTTLGERLSETEVSESLDNFKDTSGNVNYIDLLQTMSFRDTDADATMHQVRLYLDALGKNSSHMDMQKRDQFIKSMRKCDNTNTGYIAVHRLLQVLNSSGSRFTVSELAALTKGITNNKNQIDYRKFLRLIMNE